MKTKKVGKTVVSFILDKSSSMGMVQDATISGFNEYIDTLKKDKKGDYSFTLTLFDTEITTPIEGVPLKKVEPLTRSSYRPSGCTALYDAVCRTINDLDVSKKDSSLVIIMTDGEENSSREYNEQKMKDIIKKLEKKGNWTFVFLGANQDSYAKASQFGFNRSNVSNYNATDSGTRMAFSSLARNTASFSAQSFDGGAGGSTANFFSAKDQEDIENTK